MDRPSTPEYPHPLNRPRLAKYIDPSTYEYYRLSSHRFLLPSMDVLTRAGQQKLKKIYSIVQRTLPKDVIQNARFEYGPSGSFYPTLSSPHYQEGDEYIETDMQNLHLVGVSTRRSKQSFRSSPIVTFGVDPNNSSRGWIYTIHKSVYYFQINNS